MKHLSITLLFMLISIMGLSASNQQQPPKARGQRGEFQNFQMEMIIKQLEIESDHKEEFRELYSLYSKSLRELRPQRHPAHKEGQRPTDEQMEAQILESFDLAEKTTALKKEYYTRFKEILTPHQIFRMYSIERQITDRLNSEIQNRANGNRPPMPQ